MAAVEGARGRPLGISGQTCNTGWLRPRLVVLRPRSLAPARGSVLSLAWSAVAFPRFEARRAANSPLMQIWPNVPPGSLKQRMAAIQGRRTRPRRQIRARSRSPQAVEGIPRSDSCQWPARTERSWPPELNAGGHEICTLAATRVERQRMGHVGGCAVWTAAQSWPLRNTRNWRPDDRVQRQVDQPGEMAPSRVSRRPLNAKSASAPIAMPMTSQVPRRRRRGFGPGSMATCPATARSSVGLPPGVPRFRCRMTSSQYISGLRPLCAQIGD